MKPSTLILGFCALDLNALTELRYEGISLEVIVAHGSFSSHCEGKTCSKGSNRKFASDLCGFNFGGQGVAEREHWSDTTARPF